MQVTWEDIYELGMGVLSISRSELMLMTQNELMCAYDGYRKRMTEQWEIARMVSYYSAAPMMKSSFKMGDIRLPTDKLPERKRPSTKKMLSADELKEMYRKSGFDIEDEEIERIIKLRGTNRVQ